MGALGRDEAGLFHRPTAAAIEHRDALSTRAFVAGGIGVHQQLANLAAGKGGRHLKGSEGHPRLSPAGSGGQVAPRGRQPDPCLPEQADATVQVPLRKGMAFPTHWIDRATLHAPSGNLATLLLRGLVGLRSQATVMSGPLVQSRIRSRTFPSGRPHRTRTTDHAADNSWEAGSGAGGVRPGLLGFPGSSQSLDSY